MTHIVVAEFGTVKAIRKAAEMAAQRGQRASDALTPFPIPEIWEQLTNRPKRPVGWVMVIAGGAAALALYIIQAYSSVVDFPLISGSRPFNAWQVFLLVMFEACILFAGFAGFTAFVRDCRFPSLHNPIFDIPAVERATQDRYFLVFESDEKSRHAVLQLVPLLSPLSYQELAL
jgi:hypothetical protein